MLVFPCLLLSAPHSHSVLLYVLTDFSAMLQSQQRVQQLYNPTLCALLAKVHFTQKRTRIFWAPSFSVDSFPQCNINKLHSEKENSPARHCGEEKTTCSQPYCEVSFIHTVLRILGLFPPTLNLFVKLHRWGYLSVGQLDGKCNGSPKAHRQATKLHCPVSLLPVVLC